MRSLYVRSCREAHRFEPWCRPGSAWILLATCAYGTNGAILRRRAYHKYRDRQRQQKEVSARTVADLQERLQALETERSELLQRVDVLQKVRFTCRIALTPAPTAGAHIE